MSTKRLVEADPKLVKWFENGPEADGFIEESAGGEFILEMVPRNCRLKHYNKRKVSSYDIGGPFIAYASPDSTYAVTKKLFDEAKKSILIGIYDFTAGYVKELLLNAMRRGVEVSLMLDLDNRPGENELFEELVKYGCEGVAAPSCASKYVHWFASSHEKVIVIDKEWTLVQSGNYTDNSIPANESDGVYVPGQFVPGNRDMGVAVQSKELANFFTKLLRADMALELKAEQLEAPSVAQRPLVDVELLEEAPAQPPKKLFPSETFTPTEPIEVTPVLSPDNYMKVVPGFLASAKKSIDIEQQYIRGTQEDIRDLMAAIRKVVKDRSVEVRIILARPIGGGKRFQKEAEAIQSLKENYGLALGKHIRILNPKHFVHCHNKLIIVDGRAVLISSQNWSHSAVSLNREAGLLLKYPAMAKYYAKIFEDDWATGLSSLKTKRTQFFKPESLASGKVVRLDEGDYAEV